MSTRFYPIYQKGNPQLRVFLPDFWMKLVPSQHSLPKNVVTFHVPIQMTKYDVKNYLEKIYNVKTVFISTRIKLGEFKKAADGNYIIKDDDVKVAYAVLPKGETFEYPNLFENTKEKQVLKSEQNVVDEMKNGFKKFLKNNNKPNVPGWFNI